MRSIHKKSPQKKCTCIQIQHWQSHIFPLALQRLQCKVPAGTHRLKPNAILLWSLLYHLAMFIKEGKAIINSHSVILRLAGHAKRILDILAQGMQRFLGKQTLIKPDRSWATDTSNKIHIYQQNLTARVSVCGRTPVCIEYHGVWKHMMPHEFRSHTHLVVGMHAACLTDTRTQP